MNRGHERVAGARTQCRLRAGARDAGCAAHDECRIVKRFLLLCDASGACVCRCATLLTTRSSAVRAGKGKTAAKGQKTTRRTGSKIPKGKIRRAIDGPHGGAVPLMVQRNQSRHQVEHVRQGDAPSPFWMGKLCGWKSADGFGEVPETSDPARLAGAAASSGICSRGPGCTQNGLSCRSLTFTSVLNSTSDHRHQFDEGNLPA